MKKQKKIYFKSSIDLKAEELIMRTAGDPGSIFPSNSCPSVSTSFHNDPKAAFICIPNDFESWSKLLDSSRMHDSAQFNGQQLPKKEKKNKGLNWKFNYSYAYFTIGPLFFAGFML